MSKCLAYICNTFGVPARRGERARFPSGDGKATEGVIVGARGRMLRIELADNTVVSADPRVCQYLGLGSGFKALSEAERRALGLMAEHGDQQVAARAVGLHEDTLRKSLESARRVLGCDRTIQAVVKYDRHVRAQGAQKGAT